jgi:mannose-6-phosphate isomerase-like protein (cupin superfamily)
MFAVLGGDDPGRVHWAPHVIEKARGYGLVLLADGSLVDTTRGESVPSDGTIVNPSTREEIAYIRTPTVEEMSRSVVRHERPPTAQRGIHERHIIGANAPIHQPHGFELRHVAVTAGASTPFYSRTNVEVLLVHRGQLIWRNGIGDRDESLTLSEGDTFTVPRGMTRQLSAVTDAEYFVVENTEQRGLGNEIGLDRSVLLNTKQ